MISRENPTLQKEVKDKINNHLIHFILQHCVKSVHIPSYSGPHFRVFGLNTERYSEYGHLLRSASAICQDYTVRYKYSIINGSEDQLKLLCFHK